MKSKKFLSILLVLLMLFSMLANVMAADIPRFSDMPENWAKTAIENAVNNGLLTGVNGKIMPDDHLTRAQMAAILNRAFGGTEKASLESFSDVKSSSWYYDDMAKAVSMGTFMGSNGKLFPDNAITREEVFTALARAFRLTSTDTAALNRFSDSASVSSWAQPSAAALVTAGYINGTNGKLNPAANITRAEFAQIMDNMVKSYLTSAGTYTNVSDGSVMINTPNVTLKNVTIHGDLIIGDGVGDGDVTLDSVKVSGRILVRGGGVNSIKIIGASEAGSVVVVRINGEVRVVVSDHANVQVIEIDDGSDDVFVEGQVGSINIRAAGVTVTANNAQIGTVTITGESSKLIVGEASEVDMIKLDARRSEAQVTGTVNSIIATNNAENAAVTGTGHVTSVEANANNVRVETPGTTVTAGPGTTGVTNGGNPVEAGTTANGQPGTDSTSGGGSSTDGDDSTTPSAVSIADLDVTANTNSDIVTVTATVKNAGSNDTAVIAFTGTESDVGPKLALDSAPPLDYNTITLGDVPVINGKISYSIYGELPNDTYTVKVTVRTASATKSDFVLDAGISLSTEFGSEYSASWFGTENEGAYICVHDTGSLDAAQYASYTYDVAVLNLTKGTSLSLVSSGTLSEDDFNDLESYDFNIEYNSPDFFTLGSYAIIVQFSLNGSLVGEASYAFSILPEAPDVSINYEHESISGYDRSTMEYYSDGKMGTDAWLSDTDFSEPNSLTDYIPSSFFAFLDVRIKSPKSVRAFIEIPTRPSAPSGLSALAATSASSNDGMITGLVSAQNYQYKLYNASTWTDAGSGATELLGLSAGTYYVRLKATSDSFSSKSITVSVLDASTPPPEAPVLESATVTEADPAKLVLKFSKDMNENGIDASSFTVSCISRNPSYNFDIPYSISSAVVNPGDPSTVELTFYHDLWADYRYNITYSAGTVVSADGVALPSFSDQAVDSQLIYDDLVITLSSNVNYNNFGELSVPTIHLSDNGGFESCAYGYMLCSDSGTPAPAPGTRIGDIAGVTTGPYALIEMAQDHPLSAGGYLVVYVYDKNDNNVIYGFGQVQIKEENLGKGWKTISFETQNDYTRGLSANRGQNQMVLTGSLSSDQQITAIGGADAGLVSADITDPANVMITVDTSSISANGGRVSFTVTIADSGINDSYVYTMNVDIAPVTPTLELISGILYVSDATPGAKIVIFYTPNPSYGGSGLYSVEDATIVVGADGTVTIDPAKYDYFTLVEGSYYYVEQTIGGAYSNASNVIQYYP